MNQIKNELFNNPYTTVEINKNITGKLMLYRFDNKFGASVLHLIGNKGPRKYNVQPMEHMSDNVYKIRSDLLTYMTYGYLTEDEVEEVLFTIKNLS